MRILIKLLHFTFLLCIGSSVLLLASFFDLLGNISTTVGGYLFGSTLVLSLVYSAVVGILADKFSMSGAYWGAKALFFGPIGVVFTYLGMVRFLRTAPEATGSLLTKHSTEQRQVHWKLFLIFLVVLVLGNVLPRLLR